ncbi:MAG: hypothetical protein V1746_05720, partial [bacterium]
MGMLGNAQKQPADPSYHLPSRKGFSFTQDSAVYLSFSVWSNVCFALTILVIGVLIIIYYRTPPMVVTQQKGVIYYRQTEFFKLRADAVRAFLKVMIRQLLIVPPLEGDAYGLEKFVDSSVIKKFRAMARKQFEGKAELHFQQVWRLTEARRYYDLRAPQYICIAAQGEKIGQEDMAIRGARESKNTSQPSLMLAYLTQVKVSEKNPWGLVLVDLREEVDVKKAEEIWKKSVEIVSTPDLVGRVIFS